jgi:DNA primase
MFTARTGEQRWHCHGCGNHGTALDLVMQVERVGVREALAALACRSGVPVHELTQPTSGSRRRVPRPSSPGRHALELAPRPVAALEMYVAQCAEALWRTEGLPIRRWLTEARGLPEEVLRVNRVGADLGVHRQPRPAGVAEVRRGAAVLPVLVEGQACYVQLRVLGAGRDFPKYLGTAAELAPNPRLGFFQPARHFDFPFERRELVVTEGIVDALSAAAAGYRAVAVLSASYADPAAVVALTRQPGQLVVAFDPDPAGRAGAERLVRFLSAHNRRPGVMALANGDLNDHLVRSQDWPVELAARVQHATARPGLMPPRGAVGLAR